MSERKKKELKMLHFITTRIIRKNRLDKLLLIDLAHGIARNMVHNLDNLRNLVICQTASQGAAQVQRAKLSPVDVFGIQYDDGADFLAPVAAGHGYDGRLGDFGQAEQFALDFEGADFLTAGFYNVGCFAALDKVHWSPGPFLRAVANCVGFVGRDGSPDGYVAGFEPLALSVRVGYEFFGGGFRILPVFLKDCRTAELDLTGAFSASDGVDFLAWLDDFVGVHVYEAGLDSG